MRFGTREKSVNEVPVCIPRSEGGDLIFRLRPLTKDERKAFDKVVPEVKVPSQVTYTEKGPIKSKADDHPAYLKKVAKRNEDYLNYLLVCGLKATPDFAFDKVQAESPETWQFIEPEFEEFGITPLELQRLLQAAMRANGFDSTFIERAEERFTVTQANQPDN
jgi:hypothetical protein